MSRREKTPCKTYYVLSIYFNIWMILPVISFTKENLTDTMVMVIQFAQELSARSWCYALFLSYDMCTHDLWVLHVRDVLLFMWSICCLLLPIMSGNGLWYFIFIWDILWMMFWFKGTSLSYKSNVLVYMKKSFGTKSALYLNVR